MITDHPQDNLPAYALDCLEESDRQEVERHLAVCATCRQEALELKEAAAQLAMSVRQVDPPMRLKHRILDRIEPKSEPAKRQGFKAWLRRLQPVWAPAGMALILVLVFSNFALWGQVRELNQSASHNNFQVVSFLSTTADEDARGVMVVTENGRFGTLVVDGLTELEVSQQYQLWLIQDGQRISGGVFSVDQWGYGAMVIRAPQPLGDYSNFGVTIEPAGGSPNPTGDKVLDGTF